MIQITFNDWRMLRKANDLIYYMFLCVDLTYTQQA